MCGVPHQSVEHHIARLVSAGRKVAVCDQVEDPRAARGLVRRDITRVVTPGTVLDAESLVPDAPSYLAALAPGEPDCGLAFLDLSTGRFHAGVVPASRVEDALALFRPREILLPEAAAQPLFQATLSRRDAPWWQNAPRQGPGFEALAARARDAASAALAYAHQMRPGGLEHIGPPAGLEFGSRMGLDQSAIATLELFESSDGARERSLFALIDRTRTPLGARALREALAHPSLDPVELAARWDAVEELVRRTDACEAMQAALEDVGDLERRFARVSVGTAGPREVAALGAGLKAVPTVTAAAGALSAGRFRSLCDAVPDTRDCVARIEATLGARAPGPRLGRRLHSRRGRRRARRRCAASGATRRERSLAIEAEERRRSGHRPSCGPIQPRVRLLARGRQCAPGDGSRPTGSGSQTLANAERYVTPALKELEEKILGAEDRIARDRGAPVRGLLAISCRARATAWRRPRRRSGELDLFASLAEVARSGRWVRPRLSAAPRLSHRRRTAPARRAPAPAKSRSFPTTPISSPGAPDPARDGPEHGRQVHVPAPGRDDRPARAGGIVRSGATRPSSRSIDRIFTRVGAADYLVARRVDVHGRDARGGARSCARRRRASLVILDEVGRGTSTFDGLSHRLGAARASPRHPRARRAFVLFATHYHELTEIALVTPGRREHDDGGPGSGRARSSSCARSCRARPTASYGIHVAELAGLPGAVIARARARSSRTSRSRSSTSRARRCSPASRARARAAGQFLLFSVGRGARAREAPGARRRPDDARRGALAARGAAGAARRDSERRDSSASDSPAPSLAGAEREILAAAVPRGVILFRAQHRGRGAARASDRRAARARRPPRLPRPGRRPRGPAPRPRRRPHPRFHRTARRGHGAARRARRSARCWRVLASTWIWRRSSTAPSSGGGALILGERAASASPEADRRRGRRRFSTGLESQGVGGCLKHFPGLGRADTRHAQGPAGRCAGPGRGCARPRALPRS